mmetsp:Transcript_56887/g.144258  ORF Transcript_56887/g.144258 Transcript_56887/m.144258 type:complete len:259 (-) Transcript_56887:860-1636(-)
MPALSAIVSNGRVELTIVKGCDFQLTRVTCTDLVECSDVYHVHSAGGQVLDRARCQLCALAHRRPLLCARLQQCHAVACDWSAVVVQGWAPIQLQAVRSDVGKVRQLYWPWCRGHRTPHADLRNFLAGLDVADVPGGEPAVEAHVAQRNSPTTQKEVLLTEDGSLPPPQIHYKVGVETVSLHGQALLPICSKHQRAHETVLGPRQWHAGLGAGDHVPSVLRVFRHILGQLCSWRSARGAGMQGDEVPHGLVPSRWDFP